jgi:hypothetical protein
VSIFQQHMQACLFEPHKVCTVDRWGFSTDLKRPPILMLTKFLKEEEEKETLEEVSEQAPLVIEFRKQMRLEANFIQGLYTEFLKTVREEEKCHKEKVPERPCVEEPIVVMQQRWVY